MVTMYQAGWAEQIALAVKAGEHWADTLRPGSTYRGIAFAARRHFPEAGYDFFRDLFMVGANDVLTGLEIDTDEAAQIIRITARPNHTIEVLA